MVLPLFEKRSYWQLFFPLIVVIIILGIQILDGNKLALLDYQRENIFNGQWWRLVSGHFVHMTWMHMMLNLAGFVVIWLIFKNILDQKIWWLLTLGSMLGVDVGLLIFHPEVKWYVGLSGVLHGLFAAGAIFQIRLYGVRGIIYLIFLILKLFWEQFNGSLPGSAELTGARVIIEAHLYGAIGGSITMLILIMVSKACAKNININQKSA